MRSRGIGRTGLALLLVLVSIGGAPAATAALGITGGPIAHPPAVTLLQPSTVINGAVTVSVRWPAATSSGAAVRRYELQVSLDGGPWTSVSLSSQLAKSITVNFKPWQVLTFQVRATDKASQTSEWAASAPVWLSAVQESDPEVELSSGWQSVSDSKAFGGRRMMTGTAGASASFSFVGSEVGWVAPRGKSKGQADVYVDGNLAGTVDLSKASAVRRQIVFRASWPVSGPHSIEVVAKGTIGRPNIDIDAFVVLGHPITQTMIGAGDIAACTDVDDEGTAALVEAVEGIVFTTGDNVYPDGSAANFTNCYEPSWGAFKERTRPVVGNHEYLNNPGAAPYFAYFGDNAGPPGLGWYRYDAGTWRIYALTSECGPSSTCAAAQLEWLSRDLAAEPHLCVAALWHRPRFSTGGHGNSTRMANVLQLLHDNGADVVITGHDHGYQRFAPSNADGEADPLTGIRQFVAGMGGAGLYQFASDHPLIETRDNTTHGVLRLDLAPGSYTWEFMGSDGPYTDGGGGTCH